MHCKVVVHLMSNYLDFFGMPIGRNQLSELTDFSSDPTRFDDVAQSTTKNAIVRQVSLMKKIVGIDSRTLEDIAPKIPRENFDKNFT